MSSHSIAISTLGFPRIGVRRELKTALERFWSGKISGETLAAEASAIRKARWDMQRAHGVTYVPSNDFSLYDHVLDTSVMVGAIPEAYGWRGGNVPLETYFAMARGRKEPSAPALEMTKWFDTNYHYLVPEFGRRQEFVLSSTKPVDEFLEAKSYGIHTRPVLLGPVTYLLLGKTTGHDVDRLSHLPALLPVYEEILRRLSAAGADWVQMDEPALVLDLDEAARQRYRQAYEKLSAAAPNLKLLVATYFGGMQDNLDTALSLPIAGLHLDLIRAPEQLAPAVKNAPKDLVLSLGVIDGRNVWRANLDRALATVLPVVENRGAEKIMLAPSCSLLHVPIDLSLESEIDPELKAWLAFAVQKIDELSALANALSGNGEPVNSAFEEARRAIAQRRSSPRIHNRDVADRVAAITPDMARRRSAFSERRKLQQRNLDLPLFPTTTIGSFPQTQTIRNARAAFQRRELSEAGYQNLLRKETEDAVRWQEEAGIDVLVHGEFERNDMVQYFGEQLSGYAFTHHGWVQSYGSRCVRPPIIYGDVTRSEPMTVAWAVYAQSLTSKPMKGMLTGPVTMLQWSFVRDDLPRAVVCRQIALALRDEVRDLEQAGIKIIQMDEPAIREGLPLRKKDWPSYLAWAIECFKLSSSGVADTTQIHTHMCYSEFNDIMDAVDGMDADVISIETARSKMELLEAFAHNRYPNDIGPGVYDIHAPRCPTVEEIVLLLEKAASRLLPDQLWVNPDCGLKTRSWAEVKPALSNMVAAAYLMRERSRKRTMS